MRERLGQEGEHSLQGQQVVQEQRPTHEGEVDQCGLDEAAVTAAVPIIGRARSLHTLLDQRTDLTSPTLTTLRENLAGFITHPAAVDRTRHSYPGRSTQARVTSRKQARWPPGLPCGRTG